MVSTSNVFDRATMGMYDSSDNRLITAHLALLMAETHAHPDERVYGNAYLPTGAVHTGDTVGVSVFMSTGR
eukprot:6145023-Pleurochrysis_carterae.AAC.1